FAFAQFFGGAVCFAHGSKCQQAESHRPFLNNSRVEELRSVSAHEAADDGPMRFGQRIEVRTAVADCIRGPVADGEQVALQAIQIKRTWTRDLQPCERAPVTFESSDRARK